MPCPLDHLIIDQLLTSNAFASSNLFAILAPRSEWDAESLREQRCDGAKMAKRFEEANALLVRS